MLPFSALRRQVQYVLLVPPLFCIDYYRTRSEQCRAQDQRCKARLICAARYSELLKKHIQQEGDFEEQIDQAFEYGADHDHGRKLFQMEQQHKNGILSRKRSNERGSKQAHFEREKKTEAEQNAWEAQRAEAAAEVEAKHAKNASKRNKKKEKRKAAIEAEREERAKRAAKALAKQVSPPAPGSWMALRIEPSGGSAMNVLSLCQTSVPSPCGRS